MGSARPKNAHGVRLLSGEEAILSNNHGPTEPVPPAQISFLLPFTFFLTLAPLAFRFAFL